MPNWRFRQLTAPLLTARAGGAMLAGMRWMAVVAALAIAALGCGGDPPRDALAGTDWDLSINSACAFSANFGDSGTYAMLTGCEFSDGTIGVQEDIGSYYVVEHQLTTLPAKTSCPAQASQETVTFAISGSSLTIQTTKSLLLLERSYPSGNGSAAAELGCFDDAGNFTPSPLVSL